MAKVKAHRTYAEARMSDEADAIRKWRGNKAADHFAKQGAKQHYCGAGDTAFKK